MRLPSRVPVSGSLGLGAPWRGAFGTQVRVASARAGSTLDPRVIDTPGMQPAPHRAPNPLLRLSAQWAVALTTFRRDGTPVSTPVNIAVHDGRVFFRTYEQAGKFKRLRNDPRVLVAPSTPRGAPTGPAIEARATLLTRADDALAGRLIDAKHTIFQGFLVRTAHRLRRYTTRHFELHPVAEGGARDIQQVRAS